MRIAYGILFSIIIITNPIVFAEPSRILIIRHAEKPDDKDDPNLSPQGFKRAQALTKLFDIHPEYADKGLPDFIFASKYIPGDNANRAIQTVTPLAKHLKIHLDIPFKGSQYEALSDLILNDSKYDGKVILISWVHGDIPKLANKLGNRCAKKWKGSVFDRVWLLEFSESHVYCSDLPESVLPGDSN